MIDFKEGLLQAANFTPVSLQAPDAWCGHLPFAAWLMKSLQPSLFVELGTHSGNSYFSFCQAARDAGSAVKCYAVDTWQGDEHAGNYGNDVFQQVYAHNQTYYAGFSRLLRMTFDDAAGYFADASVDLLHIDGLHTYEAVKHDFDTWLPKLAPGAIVLFHDINVRERGFGVWKLWEELQGRYPRHLEFVHSHGLGVLQIDGEAQGKNLAWLRAGCAEQQVMRSFFSALGARQLERYEVREVRAQLAAMHQAGLERDALVVQLHDAIAERSVQLHTANLALIERDAELSALRGVSGVQAERDAARHELAERDAQLAAARDELAERDAQLAAARHELVLRDAHIRELGEGLLERDNKALKAWQALQG
jgi:hypothetical protein